jgi:hypothetical protein
MCSFAIIKAVLEKIASLQSQIEALEREKTGIASTGYSDCCPMTPMLT